MRHPFLTAGLVVGVALLIAVLTFAQAPVPDEPATETERLRSYAEWIKKDRDDKEAVISNLLIQVVKLRQRVQALEQAAKPTGPLP